MAEKYTLRMVAENAMMALFSEEKKQKSVFFACLDGAKAEPGDKVLLEDEEVGVILQSACCPKKGCVIGSAMLREDVAVSGIVLALEDKGEIETVSSPVVRPVSWDQPIA